MIFALSGVFRFWVLLFQLRVPVWNEGALFLCEWECGALESVLEKNGYNDGRVAQLGEHLLCKHAVISPKSLNRRLLTVQTPLLVGLLIGLHKIKVMSRLGQTLRKNGRRELAQLPRQSR